jgi:hypothetical protein
MDQELYISILKSIPVHIGELYLDQDVREIIAKEIAIKLSDTCNHEWKNISEIKLIDPLLCKKCGKVKSL